MLLNDNEYRLMSNRWISLALVEIVENIIESIVGSKYKIRVFVDNKRHLTPLITA